MGGNNGSSSSSSSSSPPCASCKLLRRRCAKDCTFAPYFPSDDPHKFAIVHKVFGASNVSKMLQEVGVEQRADAVSSLVYEANARMRDPVYGCVGAISFLQNQVSQLQMQLALAQAEMLLCIQQQQQQPEASNMTTTTQNTFDSSDDTDNNESAAFLQNNTTTTAAAAAAAGGQQYQQYLLSSFPSNINVFQDSSFKRESSFFGHHDMVS